LSNCRPANPSRRRRCLSLQCWPHSDRVLCSLRVQGSSVLPRPRSPCTAGVLPPSAAHKAVGSVKSSAPPGELIGIIQGCERPTLILGAALAASRCFSSHVMMEGQDSGAQRIMQSESGSQRDSKRVVDSEKGGGRAGVRELRVRVEVAQCLEQRRSRVLVWSSGRPRRRVALPGSRSARQRARCMRRPTGTGAVSQAVT